MSRHDWTSVILLAVTIAMAVAAIAVVLFAM
jgi:hypothetical protein